MKNSLKNFLIFLIIILFLLLNILNANAKNFCDLKIKIKDKEIYDLINDWKFIDALTLTTKKINQNNNENAFELYLSLTIILKMLGKIDDAIKSAETAYQINSNEVCLLYYLSLLHLTNSNIEMAKFYFLKLSQLTSPNPWIYLINAFILKATGNFQSAYDEIKKALKIDENIFELHAFLYSYYKKRKKYERAKTELKHMLKLIPNFELTPYFKVSDNTDKQATINKVKAEIYYELGHLTYHFFKNPKLALKYYLQADKLNTLDFKIKIGLAQCYLLLNEKKLANEIFDNAYNINPTNEIISNFYKKFEFEDSIEVFVNIDIDDLNKKEIKFKVCNFCKSINNINLLTCTNCKKSLKLDNNLNVNERYQSIEVTEEIENQYDKLLDEGLELLEKKEFKIAQEKFKEMLKLIPTSAEAYNLLGISYLGLSDFNLAIECFNQSITLQPDFIEGYFSLGKVYELQQNIEAAQKMYQKALELDSEYDEAKKALKKLNNKN